MNYYKYDTHVHTSETSPCGKVDAKTLVHLYKKAGYSGVVITDHYYEDFFVKLPYDDWSKKMDKFLSGYYTALDEGKRTGLNVLLGIELRFTENSNEYLVYGFSPDFLYKNPKLYEMNIRSFKKLVENTPMLVYQAHPFRVNMIPTSPEYIYGIEIFNGNPRQVSNNHLAYDYAVKNNLKMLSGSDFHQMQDTARGGIIINEAPVNSLEFVEFLRNNEITDFIKTE
ncbi:MAG TPA: PHP domain-containing protein [Thermoclostridium sp.]